MTATTRCGALLWEVGGATAPPLAKVTRMSGETMRVGPTTVIMEIMALTMTVHS